jgi:hypothetical protein
MKLLVAWLTADILVGTRDSHVMCAGWPVGWIGYPILDGDSMQERDGAGRMNEDTRERKWP